MTLTLGQIIEPDGSPAGGFQPMKSAGINVADVLQDLQSVLTQGGNTVDQDIILNGDTKLDTDGAHTTGPIIDLTGLNSLASGDVIDMDSNSDGYLGVMLHVKQSSNDPSTQAVPVQIVNNGVNNSALALLGATATIGVRGSGTTNPLSNPIVGSCELWGSSTTGTLHCTTNSEEFAMKSTGFFAFSASGINSNSSSRLLLGTGYTTSNALADSSANEDSVQIPAPHSGRIGNMRVLTTPAGNGTNVTYTVRRGGINTPLAVTIGSLVATGSNTTDFVAVDAGDLISVRVTKAGGLGSSPNDIKVTFGYVKD